MKEILLELAGNVEGLPVDNKIPGFSVVVSTAP